MLLKQLIVVIAIVWGIVLQADTAVDICNENFDNEIQKQLARKDKLEELRNFCIEKKDTIKKAYINVKDFEEKIRNITRNNLIKSTLKLGYEFFQEITPLGGLEGQLSEIGSWLISKAEGYVVDEAKEALGIKPKDYYDVHIQVLSDDYGKLTPELELLLQMQNASLEAFKIKVQMEQNQTVGDIGALYAKLKNLAEQSEVTKRSLYAFYIKMNDTAENSSSELSQIDNIIDTYKLAKSRTCVDSTDTTDTQEPEMDVPSIEDVDISYTVIPADECSYSDLSDAESKLNSLIKENQALVSDFKVKFEDALKGLNKYIWNEQNASSAEMWKEMNEAGFEECDASSCRLFDEKIGVTYSKSLINYTKNLELCKSYLNKLEDLSDEYDYFAIGLKDSFSREIEQIKSKNSEIKSLMSYCNNCDYICATSGYSDLNYLLDEMYSEIFNNKRTFVNFIAKEEGIKIGIEYVLSNLDSEYHFASNCVKRDANDLDDIIPSMQELLNYFDERDMAIKNLLDYLKNLQSMGMINMYYDYEEGITTTYITYNVNDEYFANLYSNFEGTDAEFLEELKEILKPISLNLQKLNSYNKDLLAIINSLYPDACNMAKGFLSRSSFPLANLSKAQELKDMLDEAENRMRKQIYIDDFFTRYCDDIIMGILPSVTHPKPFQDIVKSIQNRYLQLKWQLAQYYYTVNMENLDNYKEVIEGVDSYKYNLENLVNLEYSGLSYLSDFQNSIDGNITYLKDNAYNLLPDDKAATYDLKANPIDCTTLMNLEIGIDSLSLKSYDSKTIEINTSTCDGREVTLSVDFNETDDSLSVTQNSNKITIISNGATNEKVALIVKLEDNYSNRIIKKLPIYINNFSSKIALKKGWNLIRGGFDLSDIDSNNNLLIVWSYSGDTWLANSKFSNIQEEIDRISIYSKVKKSDYFDQNIGVWVYALEDTEIEVKSRDENYDSIKIENLGWSLVGSINSLDINSSITCKDAVLDAIWAYSDNQWKVYIKDGLQDMEQIEPNSGFWAHCRSVLY